MEPINLRPFLKPILILQTKSLSMETIMKHLSFSKRRAIAVLDALISLDLIERKKVLYMLTRNGNAICDRIVQNNWSQIHNYLKTHHNGYRVLNLTIRNGYDHRKGQGVARTEIGDYERELFKEDEGRKLILTNDVIIGFLLDWGERLGQIMENKLSSVRRLFAVLQDPPKKDEYHLLKLSYQKLSGTGLGARPYVSVPLLRETSCETLRISRSLFDAMLTHMLHEEPKIIRLVGAPKNTLSVKGARTIKSINYSANDVLEVESSPLYGLKVNNRDFYYIHMDVDKL